MFDVVVQLVGCRTCDQQVVGSTPGRRAAAYPLWASCSHPCVCVAKMYTFVPVSGHALRLGGNRNALEDFVGLTTYGLKAYMADENTAYALAPLYRRPVLDETQKIHN